MRSTGIKTFLRNVPLSNLRLKANCLLDLVGSLEQKSAGRSTQLSAGKECFLEDLCNKYKRSFFLSDVTPLKLRDL